MAAGAPDRAASFQMNAPLFTRQLTFRLTLIVAALFIVTTALLYATVTASFTRFAGLQLDRQMTNIAHDVYSLCEEGLIDLERVRRQDDPVERRIVQAHVLGRLEDMLRRRNIIGFVVSGAERLVIDGRFDPAMQDAFLAAKAEADTVTVAHGAGRYSVIHTRFEPWDWQIVLARDLSHYQAYIGGVQALIVAIAAVLLAMSIMLFFVLRALVHRPVEAIVASVRSSGLPSYTGVAEFEELSDRLRDALRQRSVLVESLEQTHFLYAHDTGGNFTYLSPSVTRILGYSVEEFRKHYSAYLTDHPSNLDVVRHTQLSIAGVLQLPYEVEILHKDGRRLWLEVSEVPVKDVAGRVVSVEGIAHDITERKRSEESLRRSEAQFRNMAEMLPEIVFSTDALGNFIYVNELALELTGYTREDMEKGLNCVQTVAEQDRTRATTNFRKILAGEYLGGLEYTMQRKDGTVFPAIIRSRTRYDEHGAPQGIWGVVVDLTEIRNAEEALRRSEEAIKAFVRSLPDPSFLLARDGTVLLTNGAFEELLGRKSEDLVGLNLWGHLPVEMKMPLEGLRRSFIDEAVQLRMPVRFDDDRGGRFFAFTIVPIADATGEITRLAVRAVDLTERRKIERERERLIHDLQKALDEVKTLRGIIPVCSSCKKIRNDQGGWQQIEEYVREHSDAEFSHGICPDCAARLYPRFAKKRPGEET